jgi:hypothetical protein
MQSYLELAGLFQSWVVTYYLDLLVFMKFKQFQPQKIQQQQKQILKMIHGIGTILKARVCGDKLWMLSINDQGIQYFSFVELPHIKVNPPHLLQPTIIKTLEEDDVYSLSILNGQVALVHHINSNKNLTIFSESANGVVEMTTSYKLVSVVNQY